MSARKYVSLFTILALLLVGCLPSSHRTALRRVLESAGQASYHGEIPRIVHLVALKPGEEAELDFSFQSFLCIYSAYQFIQPSTIFIHTDYTRSDIEHAISHGSSWTRKILTAFSDTVRINPVRPPTLAANGSPLEHAQHRSDFVRMEQVAVHGGIYLDWDVLTLRSPLPLLRAGFASVVARHADGRHIHHGCFMARRGAALVRLMVRDMPAAFTGERHAHTTGLLTPIAERIAYVPGEVLIVDYKAFAPAGRWWCWSSSSSSSHGAAAAAAGLFSEAGPGEGPVALGTQANVATLDALDRWNHRARGAGWEVDFSQAYFLHAPGPAAPALPRFEGVTVPYVLRRRSNYALAAWPLVMQGIREGLIDEGDGISLRP